MIKWVKDFFERSKDILQQVQDERWDKKYLIQFLMLFIFCHAHAMEIIKQDPSIPCNDVCYLNQMPREILDYIAGFLMESKEEFVARTLAEKKKKDAMHNDLRYHEVHVPNEHLRSRNRKRGVVLNENGARLALFDGVENPKKGYMYTKLEKSSYECCALSPSGRIIAIFYRKFLPGEKYSKRIVELLRVRTEDIPEQQNGNLIIEERREIFSSNDNVCFKSLAFNQQGWQLIAWRLSSDDTVDERNYRIFPVGVSFSLSTNRLQEYLRDKCVCNTYVEGKK